MAWPNETVLQSKFRGPLLCSWLSTLVRSQRHFIASAVIFSRKWLAQLVSQTPERRPPSSVWCFSCTTLGKSIPLPVWPAILYSCILDPNLGAVFVILFSFEFIPLLFIPIAWNNPSCLVGFCVAKALFVYLPQYWNSNQSKFSILLYPNYRKQYKKSFLEFTKFCKGSCHLVCSCVYNSWVVVIIIANFELRK